MISFDDRIYIVDVCLGVVISVAGRTVSINDFFDSSKAVSSVVREEGETERSESEAHCRELTEAILGLNLAEPIIASGVPEIAGIIRVSHDLEV